VLYKPKKADSKFKNQPFLVYEYGK